MVLYEAMGNAILLGKHPTDRIKELLIDSLHTSIPQNEEAASFSINHAIPQCSDSRLSLGHEHGS